MNNKQQNTLRSLLKKYEYKNASNLVRQGMGINFENFLQKTEPLYVIPRIASCYAEEEKKKKLMGIVYKEWLKDVVEKRWVNAINTYSDEHGERIVLQAIYYLMDNNLWDVYEGRLALDAKEDSYYDKLSDMPSAIAIVKESNTANEKEEETKQTEAAPADIDWVHEPKYILSADGAMTLMCAINEMSMHLRQNIEKLQDYIYTAANSDVLREKIDKQQKQIEELQSQLAEAQGKVDEANKTMSKASDYIAKQKADAAEAQKQYDELNKKYKKALDERDDADKELAACKKLLEEEAQKETLPKKKVIPFSVLDAVPLLGKGVMTGLEPTLARYNIIVDHNK